MHFLVPSLTFLAIGGFTLPISGGFTLRNFGGAKLLITKSRARPDSGKRIAWGNGVYREENRKEAKDKSLAPRTETWYKAQSQG